MSNEKIINSDGTKRSCPRGSSISFPIGHLVRVKVGDDICRKCPCFCGVINDNIQCSWPDFKNNL